MPRILIIDDDKQIRELVRLMLREEGYEGLEVTDGADALQACQGEEFDLVLCDIFMPGRDGLETIRGLRRAFPGLRIVAMSGGGWGYRRPTDVLRVARLMGAAAVLEKPFSRQDLANALGEALGHARGAAGSG